METQRSFLVIVLLVLSFLLYQQWQGDYGPQPVQQPVSQTQSSSDNNSDDFVPSATNVATAQPVNKPTVAQAQVIDVTTDVLSIKINARGGDIIEAVLLDYETEQGSGIPLTIMQNSGNRYIAQSGLIGANGIDTQNNRATFETIQSSYQLNDNETLDVDLTYEDGKGLSFTKRFTFTKGQYDVKVTYLVSNNTASNATVQMYSQLLQSSRVESTNGFIPTYRGAAFSTQDDRYEKYDFSDIEDANLNKTTTGGWVAMLQHYFVSAWVPSDQGVNSLYTSYNQRAEASIGVISAPVTVPANGHAETSAVLYVGPKIQDTLKALSPNLEHTVDYGFLFMISVPLFWLLTAIQSIVTNWGIAIIIITLIVKGAMYPLTKAQYTSMAKMRNLQPKMTQLKERFGDDRQKMSQAMMELYRKEKVNPAGGCLPLLIQMPIFLALYWVFLESVELRHAEFGLWLTDLSSKDPLYILPILMGISMFIMQKMQPMTIQDPMQQKIMQYMPVAFTVFFFWFPSGLVLYWLISNVISIVQMKIIFAGMEKNK